MAAERLLGGLVDGLRFTVRANVYEPGGGVPAHVDDSALTVVFTPVPEALLAAPPGCRAPLRPVATGGWHAVVLPGAQVGRGAARARADRSRRRTGRRPPVLGHRVRPR